MGDLIFCCFFSVVLSVQNHGVFTARELSHFFRGACLLQACSSSSSRAAAASSSKQQAAAAWNDNGDVTRAVSGVKDAAKKGSVRSRTRTIMPPTRSKAAAAKAAADSDATAAAAQAAAAAQSSAVQCVDGSSSDSASDSDDSDWANIDTSKLAIQRVEPLRGRPKGGHVWKDQKLARFSSLFSKGGDNRLEKKNEVRLQFQSMKQLEKDLRAETVEEKQEMRRKREQRDKQKKDNELKSQLGTLVSISTVKMRKYSKKALRGVVKVDLDELKKKGK